MTTALRCIALLPLFGLLAGCANTPTSVAGQDPFANSDPFQTAENSPPPAGKMNVWQQPEAQVGQATALAAPHPYRQQTAHNDGAGWSSASHVTHPEFQSVSSAPVQTAAVSDDSLWGTPAPDSPFSTPGPPIQQTEYQTARPLDEPFRNPISAESDTPVFVDSPAAPAGAPDWWTK